MPKPGKEQELWDNCKQLISLSRNEAGCVKAHATKQIKHPDSLSTSKYSIVLLQKCQDVKAFDDLCSEEYVTGFFENYIEDEKTSIVED